MGKKRPAARGDLEIGSSAIKRGMGKHQKGRLGLVSFGMEALAPDTVVDGAIMGGRRWRMQSADFDAQRTNQGPRMWPPRIRSLGDRQAGAAP